MERQSTSGMNLFQKQIKGESVETSEVMMCNSDDDFQGEQDMLNTSNDPLLDPEQLEDEMDGDATMVFDPSAGMIEETPSTSRRQPVENEDGNKGLKKDKLQQCNIILNQQRRQLNKLKEEIVELEKKLEVAEQEKYNLSIIAEWEVNKAEELAADERKMRLKAESDLRALLQQQQQLRASSGSIGDSKVQVNTVADDDGGEVEIVGVVEFQRNESLTGPGRSMLSYGTSHSSLQKQLSRYSANAHHLGNGNLGMKVTRPVPGPKLSIGNNEVAPVASQAVLQSREEGVHGVTEPAAIVNTPSGVKNTNRMPTVGPSKAFPRQTGLISEREPGPSARMNPIDIGSSANTQFDTGEKPFPCNLCNTRFSKMATMNRHKMIKHGVKDKVMISCRDCPMLFKSRKEHMGHRITVHGTRVGARAGPRIPKTVLRSNENDNPALPASTSSSATTGKSPSLAEGTRIRRTPKRLLARVDPDSIKKAESEQTSTTKPPKLVKRNYRVMSGAVILHESKGHKLIGQDPINPSAFYQCLCGCNFQRRATFLTHLRFKKFGKVFNCSICRKNFICNSTLKTHMKQIHQQVSDTKFACGICGQGGFLSLSEVTTHRQNAHSASEVKCSG